MFSESFSSETGASQPHSIPGCTNNGDQLTDVHFVPIWILGRRVGMPNHTTPPRIQRCMHKRLSLRQLLVPSNHQRSILEQFRSGVSEHTEDDISTTKISNQRKCSATATDNRIDGGCISLKSTSRRWRHTSAMTKSRPTDIYGVIESLVQLQATAGTKRSRRRTSTAASCVY